MARDTEEQSSGRARGTITLPPPEMLSRSHKPDQQSRPPAVLGSHCLIWWTGPGEGPLTVIFLLALLQEQMSCDS